MNRGEQLWVLEGGSWLEATYEFRVEKSEPLGRHSVMLVNGGGRRVVCGCKTLTETPPVSAASASPSLHPLLQLLGEKWSAPALYALKPFAAQMRGVGFNELRRSIPAVSQRMLSVTLKGLVEGGLVFREVLSTAPPRVNYHLSPRGLELLTMLEQFGAWAQAGVAQ